MITTEKIRTFHMFVNRTINVRLHLLTFILFCASTPVFTKEPFPQKITSYKSPLLFTENAGQWNKEIIFGSIHGGHSIAFTKSGFSARIRGYDAPSRKNISMRETPEIDAKTENTLQYKFNNVSPKVQTEGKARNIARSNFYLGNDSLRWREDVGNYNAIVYKDVWNNIDVEFGTKNGKLIQTFIVHPGGNTSDISLALETEGESLGLGGMLRLTESYQVVGNKRQPIPSRLVSSGSSIHLQSSGGTAPARKYFRTEFSTYLGGRECDYIYNSLIDSLGNIFITGGTHSYDLPVKAAHQPALAGDGDAFFMKFNCDGRTMEFSTFIGGTLGDGGHRLAFGNDNTIFLLGWTLSNNYPRTSNALPAFNTNNWSITLNRFTSDGRMILSMPKFVNNGENDGTIGGFCGITTDRNGRIYIISYVMSTSTSSAEKSFPYVTANAIQSQCNGRGDACIMILSPTGESVEYGTFVGGSDVEWGCDIHIDSDNNIIVSGWTRSSDYPLVNPQYSRSTKDTIGFSFITKISPASKKIIYSMLIPNNLDWVGSGLGWGGGWNLAGVDSHGNALLVFPTKNAALPTKNPIQDTAKSVDLYIAKLSPEGDIIYATYFGGSGDEYPIGVALDRDDNIYIHCLSNSQEFVSSGEGNPLFILYQSRNIVRSVLTIWGAWWYNWGQFWLRNNLFLDHQGYIYFYGNRNETHEEIPIFNNFQKSFAGGWDGFLSRLYIPLLNASLSCTVSSVPKIRYDLNSGEALTNKFPVSVTVRNTEPVKSVDVRSVEIQLPKGLFLDPPGQSLVKSLNPSILAPGKTETLTWTVSMDDQKVPDSNQVIEANAIFTYPGERQQCPLPFAQAERSIPVEFVAVPRLELVCAISMPDSLKLDAPATGYQPQPFPVSVVIRNKGKSDAKLDSVRLCLPAGMGLLESPAGDLSRPAPVLRPGEVFTADWLVSAVPRAYIRSANITVIGVDTFGVAQTQCERTIYIPAAGGLRCSSAGQDTVFYSASQGKYLPDPLQAFFTFTNTLDTVMTDITAELDLSGSPSLALASGESALRQRGYLASGGNVQFQWKLVVKEPVITQRQVVTVSYRSGKNPQRQYCIREIIIIPPVRKIFCSLYSPDSLRLSHAGTSYEPNPFQVRFILKNEGQTLSSRHTAEIVSSYPLSFKEALKRSLNALPSGASDTLVWTATALTSLYARNIDFTVTVTDTAGKTAAVCAKSLFLPPVPRGLFCDLTAPDTLKYDVASDTYSPNLFSCSVKLENVLDTAQTTVEAEIDLTGAQHLELVSGETAMKQLPDIIARGQSSVAWNVTVQSSTDKPVTETILVRYRSANEQEWRTCERTILIQGEKRIRSAKCSVKGHDTLWADIRYEDIIPQPAQVQYTITNTGNVPLTGCSAAIILPAKYELEPGCDSIQTYGIIPPGMSASREWFITVNKTIAFPGTDDIQWTWTCYEMTTDIPCRHAITLAVGIPHGITLTPWKLRFMAKQDGPLPASQKIKLWPGNGSPVFWQAQSALPWLDWQPQSGTLSSPIEITVRPTTTAMPVGTYSGSLNIISAMQSTPPDVLVEFEIYRILNVERKQSTAGFTLEQNYPNPVSGDRYSVIRFTVTEKSFAVLKLFDAFGRELATLHSGETPAGTYSIRLDAAVREQLPAGVYYYTLNAGGRSGTRVMIVR